jgi:DNA-binding NarL/FixJ family response regulator
MVAGETSLLESEKQLQAPLVIVDLSLTPGEGLALVRRLRFRFPYLKLIVLSVHDEPNVIQTVLEAGANGFVLKRAIASDLLPAVDAVLAGQRYVSLRQRKQTFGSAQ